MNTSRRALLGGGALTVAGLSGCTLLESTEPVSGTVSSHQVDASNSGASSDGPTARPGELWRLEAGSYGDVGPLVSSGLVVVGIGVDGAEYVEGRTIALSSADGEPVWEFETDHPPRATGAIVDGHVVVPMEGGTLASVSVESGAVRWERTVTEAENPRAAAFTVGLATDGDVVLAAGEGVLAAVDVDDGERRWITEKRIASSPAIAAGRAYVGTYDGAAIVLDVETGDELARETYETDLTAAPTVTADDVLVGGVDGVVRALSRTDLDERWRVQTGGPIYGSPAVTEDTAYVASADGTVLALALDDGTRRWQNGVGTEFGSGVFASPVVGGETVYAVTGDGTVVAFERGDGTERWRVGIDLEAPVRSAPAVLDDRVFVTDRRGTVVALAESAGGWVPW